MSDQTKRGRPHLAAAVFCERVLVETDGVATLVRIIDIVNIERIKLAAPRVSSPTMPRGPSGAGMVLGALQLYVALKSGDFSGEGEVTIKAFRPSGEEIVSKTPPSIRIELKGGHFGANVAINLGITFEDNGVHWFEVHFENELLTRVPLSVVVWEQTTENAPSEPS